MPSFVDSWQTAWSTLGVQPDPALFDHLLAAYAEPHRRYHTRQHLQECLDHLQPALGLAAHPGEVALALWFHDAVYALDRHDNEPQSADWARQAVLAAGVAPAVGARIHALILATRHAALPATPDEGLLVDIDLAILGAAPERFDGYERQVREEYAAVPKAQFSSRRQAILEGFLRRPSLFSTELFRARLEAPARANLQRSIARLQAGSGDAPA